MITKSRLYVACLLISIFGYSEAQDVKGILNAAREQIIQAGNDELFCRTFGSGKPIIVLHGGPGLSQDYLLPNMSRLAQNLLVVFYGQQGVSMDFKDVQIKRSGIGQFEDDLGAFAKRDFKKGEVVIKWNLSVLTHEEYKKLPKYEQENFCHKRNGIIHCYPDPERHVNRSNNPNLVPDFEKEANIALRDIKKGEELSISNTTKEDF